MIDPPRTPASLWVVVGMLIANIVFLQSMARIVADWFHKLVTKD